MKALGRWCKRQARLSHPNLDIKPVLDKATGPPARAHICLDTVCLPPVTDPAELAASVTSVFETQDSPFENIFERFSRIMTSLVPHQTIYG